MLQTVRRSVLLNIDLSDMASTEAESAVQGYLVPGQAAVDHAGAEVAGDIRNTGQGRAINAMRRGVMQRNGATTACEVYMHQLRFILGL